MVECSITVVSLDDDVASVDITEFPKALGEFAEELRRLLASRVRKVSNPVDLCRGLSPGGGAFTSSLGSIDLRHDEWRIDDIYIRPAPKEDEGTKPGEVEGTGTDDF